MQQRSYYAYIMASKKEGTLYIGVTHNLAQRVDQHKQKEYDGFTKKYDVTRLVYYEAYRYVEDAITREKRIKKWRREWKVELIEGMNPEWRDLFDEIAGSGG